MFAVMVTGRLAQTQCEQITETQSVFTIADADNINHIVVFMTGTTPFPEGYGAQVYFSWPEPNAPPTWLLLGHLANDKPSAIFKVSGLKHAPNTVVDPTQFGQQQFSHLAQIGLSIEPLFTIQQSTPAITTEPFKGSKFAEFTQKMLDNFVNYMTSFGITQSEMTPNPNETFLPMSKMQTWYANFQRRLAQNPDFIFY
ncbi:protein OPI10 homolog [Neocloeon triangulifer]|uniref:protein OPI10 homolog n=1 Tax=Neocloeon triangulifer TaxID=2078957 RepID=UPI00286EFDF7|nr:protein OPI10 homolog [Neocloeon triangulifer]